MEQAENQNPTPAAAAGKDPQGTLALDFAEQQQRQLRRNATVAPVRIEPAATRTILPRAAMTSNAPESQNPTQASVPASAPASTPIPLRPATLEQPANPRGPLAPVNNPGTGSPASGNPAPRTGSMAQRRPMHRPPDLSHIHNLSLGRALQDARESLGLNVKEVAEQTRIKSTYLEYLEQDRIEQLPPPVYIRAYIRSLAALYNLDAAVLTDMLEQHTRGNNGRVVSEEIIMQIEKDKQGNPEEEKKVKRLMLTFTGIAALVLALIGASVYFMMTNRHANGSQVTVAATDTTAKAAVPTGIPAATGNTATATTTATTPGAAFDIQKLDSIAIPPSVTVNQLAAPSEETPSHAKPAPTRSKRRR